MMDLKWFLYILISYYIGIDMTSYYEIVIRYPFVVEAAPLSEIKHPETILT